MRISDWSSDVCSSDLSSTAATSTSSTTVCRWRTARSSKEAIAVKYYFHRRETERITRVAEFEVEAHDEAEALAKLVANPDAYWSERPGSGTTCAVMEREIGKLEPGRNDRSEEHTTELQSLMSNS